MLSRRKIWNNLVHFDKTWWTITWVWIFQILKHWKFIHFQWTKTWPVNSGKLYLVWSIRKCLFNDVLWLGLHDILHAIVMHISSVKTVLWLAVNIHHLFSNGAAFNTQSRRSLISYAIHAQNHRWIACDSLRFTANQRTVFTDEMRMTIACKI